ncbi:hypothetical protein BX592_111170 [Paraburkholderia rhizosphaerae]|uniref:Uncharacterized protein n=1 Tax=Paraburkholderia rhizosphaerae TaxID=480658 RepID=A0A4R8LRU7_9BURK|nr:hypothetical protein BX592_111170 [Paraburkholderia rhizosphaerae]
MLSKWLSKPKCDHRWPASVRLSAIKRHSLAPSLGHSGVGIAPMIGHSLR